MKKSFVVMLLVLLMSGCGGSSSNTNSVSAAINDNPDSTAGDVPDASPGNDLSTATIRNDFIVHLPDDYDENTPAPLLLSLHGFTSNAQDILGYFQLVNAASEFGFIVVSPEGSLDANGDPHWNATDACCAFTSQTADDVGYLSGVIDEVEATYNVDPRRIYFTGHSNGHFMSYRMACEMSDRIAAIAGLAGATWFDDSLCESSEPVGILHVHGTRDEVVFFGGGFFGLNRYPSAEQTVTSWARRNGCSDDVDNNTPNIDVDFTIEGDETQVTRYVGCPDTGTVELWTIDDGLHSPALNSDWPNLIMSFLAVHSKP